MRKLYHWQRQFLGLKHFPGHFGAVEVPFFFTFSQDDIKFILGFEARFHIVLGLQLGFLRMTGSVLTKVPLKVPPGLLQHLADQFQLPAPRIASLRSLYKNAKGTWDGHQVKILEYTGVRRLEGKVKGNLTTHIKRECKTKADVFHLTQSAMAWMYQRGYLIGGTKTLEKEAGAILERSTNDLYTLIKTKVTDEQLAVWEERLLDTHPDGGMTWMQWLSTPPRGRPTLNQLSDRIIRVQFLHTLDVQKVVLSGIALERIHHYALELKHMKPSKFAALKDVKLRTIRLVCYLRHTLSETTDIAVAMSHRLISKTWRDAVDDAKNRDTQVAIAARSILNEIHHLYRRDDLSPEQAWPELGEILSRDTTRQFKSRAAAARYVLTDKNSPIRAILKEVDKLDLSFGSEAGKAYNALLRVRRGLYGPNQPPSLEPGAYVKVNSAWNDLLADSDRERAFRALECATLFAIRKGLRNGSIYIESSSAYRNREELLIASNDWDKHRASYYDNLDIPMDPNDVLDAMKADLRAKCDELSKQVVRGELSIRKGAIKFPPIRERDYPQEWDTAVESLGNRLPIVQLPDLLLEVDAHAGVSKAILGRYAKSEEELLQIYGGMLAHACALDATEVALMVPGLTAESVKIGQRYFYDPEVVRNASDAVSSYHRHFEVTKAWGDGSMASADMMAVDVPDKMWKARVDPKRNVSSYGVYTTLSDQGTLIYGQPVPLNIRQAGPALESVIRQREVEVDQLAVDTHGYTDFAFGQAKALHIDLCPQLKSMRDRKIHLPNEMAPFEGLEGICNNTIVMGNIRAYWDPLMRIAASIESGQVSANIALAKFGSAAKGDPIYNAGVHFGRLCRSLFLCDYYLNDDFRHEIKNILSQGEAVHVLQREIHTGSHAKPRQEEEHMVALSLTLTLVTNMVMAWNTSRIQALVNENGMGTPEWMRVMRPARSAHVNFRGTMKFPVRTYASRLIAGGARREVA